MYRHARSTLREPINLAVRRAPASRRTGLITCGRSGRAWRCALGEAGVTVRKREGDGATPAGHWRLRAVCYRPDRVARPSTGLPVRALHPGDGWCDESGDRNYNRLVRLPYPASAERMWREDHLYDIVVILDYNIRPRARRRGSAIFLHVAAPGYAPTRGCVALCRHDLLTILRHCRRGGALAILA